MRFVKFKRSWYEIKSGSQIDNATIINCGGMIIGINIDLREYEIIEANSFEELDWTNTDVLNKSSRFGWLDREGNFYGCDFASHEFQAQIIHKSTRWDLEEAGWIHISSPSKYDSYIITAEFRGDYDNGVMPTDKQMEYLCSRNDVQFSQVLEAYENGNRAKARIYEENLLKKNSKKDNNDLTM